MRTAAPAAEQAWAVRTLQAVAFALAVLLAVRPWAAWGTHDVLWGWGGARWAPLALTAPALTLAALALWPSAAARALPLLDALGAALIARGARGRIALALAMLAAAALVFALPDQSGFVGDFLMRLGFARRDIAFARSIPQAMPLDALLHGSLPAWLAAKGLDPLLFERLLGAARAALLVAAGAECARSLGARGAVAALVTGLVTLQAGLALCTGYGKSLADLVLVTAWCFAAMLACLRTGREVWRLVGATLLAVALHRSGLLLAPAAMLALALRAAATGDAPQAPPWRRLLPLAALLAGLACGAPWLAQAFGRADAEHLAALRAPSPWAGAGLLTVAHALARLDLLAAVAPLAFLLPVLGLAVRGLTGRERAVLLLWTAPALALVWIVEPRQGLPRDWDVFAPAAMALTLAVAALLTAAFAQAASRRGLALALVCVAALPAWDRLLIAHDTARTIAMVREVVAGEASADAQRAQLHHYMGVVLARDGDWDAALPELREAGRLAPSSTHLQVWYRIAVRRGALNDALEAARALVGRDSSQDWPGIVARLEAIAAARRARQAAGPGARAGAP